MKIQAIKEIVLGPRQMTFGFDDDTQKKQDRVISLIVEQVETHGRAVLDLFVATAEQQLNLSQIDILQTIFWSAHELKIQFRVDGKNIPPFETKQVLLKSSEKCVELITNKCPQRKKY